MIRRPATYALCLPLSLLLASCNQQTEQGKATAAGGEVLPGSISDEMIDLDTSTASPPLAPVKQAAPKKDAADKAGEDTEVAGPVATASADTE